MSSNLLIYLRSSSKQEMKFLHHYLQSEKSQRRRNSKKVRGIGEQSLLDDSTALPQCPALMPPAPKPPGKKSIEELMDLAQKSKLVGQEGSERNYRGGGYR